MPNEVIFSALIILGMMIIFFFAITMMKLSDVMYELKTMQKNDDRIDDSLYKIRMDLIKYK